MFVAGTAPAPHTVYRFCLLYERLVFAGSRACGFASHETRWCRRCHISCVAFAFEFLLLHIRYPGRKEENWWLLIGREEENSCLVIKRVPLKQKATTKLQFIAPDTLGKQELTLYFMCDSWNGCDQVCSPLYLWPLVGPGAAP